MTQTSSESATADGLPWRVDTWRRRPEVVFEASVPRLLRGDNRTSASVDEVLDVISGVYDEVAEQVEWLCDAGSLEIVRLDLVRDFTTTAPIPLFLEAVAQYPAERARTLLHMSNGQDRGVQTLYRITDRWEVRAYDRGEAYSNRAATRSGSTAGDLQALAEAAQGHLRYELQLRSRAVRQHGLGRVQDLEATALDHVARHYFRRSRLNRRVGSDGDRLGEAAKRLESDGRYKQLAPMIGHLVLEHLGLPAAQTIATQRKYRRLAAELDLAAGDLAGATEPMRLDFDLGQLLTGRAAAQPATPVEGPRLGDSRELRDAHTRARGGQRPADPKVGTRARGGSQSASASATTGTQRRTDRPASAAARPPQRRSAMRPPSPSRTNSR